MACAVFGAVVGTQGRRAPIPSVGTRSRAPIFHAGTQGRRADPLGGHPGAAR